MTMLSKRQGIVAIPLVVLLSVLTLAIGLSITTLTYNETFSQASIFDASKAYSYADAALRDVLRNIARDYQYTCSANPTYCYTMEFGTNGCTATGSGVACGRVYPITTRWTPKTVEVEGQSGNVIRKLRATVTYYDGVATGSDGAIQGSMKNVTIVEI